MHVARRRRTSSMGDGMRLRPRLRTGLLTACLLLMIAGSGAESAQARQSTSALCPGGLTANRPWPGYGGLGFSGSALCVKSVHGVTLLTHFRAVAALWALEDDSQWHMVATAGASPVCFNYGDARLCSLKPQGFSGVYPPSGKYHTQLLVYARTPQQLEPFDGAKIADLNSEEYCLQPSLMARTSFPTISCWPSGPM